MSAIKLSTPSSGSISLSPANTASNLTITVPAVTGTMATVDGSGNASVTGNLSFNSGYGSSAVAYGCRAWVNFNGQGTVAIRASGNVSSITDNGTGNYNVNFTTSMPDVNYSTCISASDQFPNIGMCPAIVSDVGAYATNKMQLILINQSTGTYFDSAIVSVQVFR
jgi:hypothetical protein